MSFPIPKKSAKKTMPPQKDEPDDPREKLRQMILRKKGGKKAC